MGVSGGRHADGGLRWSQWKNSALPAASVVMMSSGAVALRLPLSAPLSDHADHAVGDEPGVDTEVSALAEHAHDRLGHASDAELQGCAVGDEIGHGRCDLAFQGSRFGSS